MIKQNITNLGIFGHVDHGKTTLTQMITGKFTDEHSEELKKGISIRLGYADFTLRKCPQCKDEKAYTTFKKCFYHNTDTQEIRKFSIVDVPGHETLMATVLTGASLIDGAILVIAANEKCPQPQTEEHLAALDLVGIKNIVIVQNKIDLVSKERALENYKEIKEFIKGTVAEKAPIIPVSAQDRINIDVLLKVIDETIPEPKHNLNAFPKMLIARSFDVNKPGTEINKLVGGVIGGSILEGMFKKGDEIEIVPGIKIKDKYEPVRTKITHIYRGNQEVDKGTPGGLIALSTDLDPSLTKSDKLVGHVVGRPGKTPPVWNKLKLEIHLMERVVGKEETIKIDSVKQNEPLLMNVGTARTIGICTKPGNTSEFILKLPVSASVGDKVALSKQINGRWRLIGYGIIKE